MFHWCNLDEVQKVIPCVFCEGTFGEDVGCLLACFYEAHLNMIVPRDLLNDEVEINSMCPGHVPHRWSALLEAHFDDRIIVLKYNELCSARW